MMPPCGGGLTLVTSRGPARLGVLVPLHPLVWLAKQVASLQHVSGGRLILGVGTGGDRRRESWAATGCPAASVVGAPITLCRSCPRSWPDDLARYPRTRCKQHKASLAPDASIR